MRLAEVPSVEKELDFLKLHPRSDAAFNGFAKVFMTGEGVCFRPARTPRPPSNSCF